MDINRIQKLAGINEEKYPSEISNLINDLISTMGYKKYQLSTTNLNGNYVIELPTTGFSVPQLQRLISILDSSMGIGYAPYTSHSGMIIKTQIPFSK